MRAIPIIVGALALASTSAVAQVGFSSGGSLLAWCEDPAHQPECTQYIAGVADAHGYDLSRFGTPRDFCTPEDITLEELERVVVKWLKDHPEKQRVTAANLVLLAFSDTYKCKSSRD